MARRAVVIGPAEYGPDSGIPSYSWISASARTYAEVLAGDEMWTSCRLVAGDELRTADGVMRAVQEVADETEPGDVFMAVYIGHGAHWRDLPGPQVHFSVESSRRDSPWTWLASWYLYRAMRKSRASLKVLIADCCYSNKLPQLGGPSDVLDTLDEGSCVLTATKNEQHFADAEGCPALPAPLSQCTPFSGHLLNVLLRGTEDHNGQLTLGLVRDAVQEDMRRCATSHDVPNMTLNGARERIPLFTNRMDPALRRRPPGHPVEPEQWVETLMRQQDFDVSDLLRDPRRTGKVVATLYARQSDGGRAIAHEINKQANERFAPREFARYWNQVERALHR